MYEEKNVQAAAEIGIDGECPLCAKNPPFNDKVLAAIKEGRAIMRGEIPAKWYHSLEEAREDVGI
ncbi:hypothetical protein FACS189491_00080 [Spirochaetia bacterium]|nr:hypothetical protein FACS189491_00080 [Spirochaetia bacterium]